MDLKGLSENEKRTLEQELSGFVDGDCPGHVTEAGSYVIASLLLGNDPIKVGPRYGKALRARITGTPWDWLYIHLRDVPLDSQLSALDSLLALIPDGRRYAEQIVRAGNVIYGAAEDAIRDAHPLPETTEDPEAIPTVQVISLKEIEPMFQNQAWLWRKWIPEGYLTMVAGDPGIGKSAVVLRLVHTVLEVGTWPDGETVNSRFAGRPALWLDTESTQAITVGRCRDWGIDSERIVFPKDPTNPDEVFPLFRLNEKRWIDLLGTVVQERSPFLVVVDSLRGAYAGDENSSEMQQVLQSLAELARDTSSAIIVVHHLRKRSADEFTQEVSMDRVRGSSAIVATMRSILALDRPDPLSKAVRMSIIKSNLCAAPEPIGVTIEDGVQFCEPPQKPRKVTAVDRAKDFLLGRLQAGPVAAADLYSDAENCGISKGSLRKAKDELGVIALREGGPADKGCWMWSRPAPEEYADHAERQFKDSREKDFFAG